VGEEAKSFRAFIAAGPSEEQRRRLLDVQERVRRSPWAGAVGQHGRFVWVKPEAFHLTLRFLGKITPEQEGAVGQILKNVAAACAPLSLALGELSGTPDPKGGHLRVLWVEARDAPLWKRLEASLSEALGAAGFAPPGRPFAAHLTLARVRPVGRGDGGRRKKDLRGANEYRIKDKHPREPGMSQDVTALWQDLAQEIRREIRETPEAPPAEAAGLSLFESRLAPEGPSYHERLRAAWGAASLKHTSGGE